jgi:hypothetical protein
VNSEIQTVLTFLRRKPLQLFPYPFPAKYKSATIKVYSDHENGLKFVLYQCKRMYFKRNWSEQDIREYYNNIQIEQDKESPHKYLSEDFCVGSGSFVADVGAAEGIFSLSIIDVAKKVFLFETDPEWIEALEATFKPWKNKTEIINKFICDRNNHNSLTLDHFIKTNNLFFDFIKIDIDGAESLLLNGAVHFFSSVKSMKVAICIYHKANDEQSFRDFFEKYGFKVNSTPGYMIFYYDTEISAPFLRRGVLQAQKRNDHLNILS